MKSSAPKRKVFNDAVDLLGNGEVLVAENGITMLPINEIRPFHNHPYTYNF